MAMHIKSLYIKEFRGIKNLKIPELSDINIITGDNNTGKTSILEALQILQAPMDIKLLLTVARKANRFLYRGNSSYEALENLFNIDSKDKKIEYSFIKDDDIEHNLLIKKEEEQETLTQKEMDTIDNKRVVESYTSEQEMEADRRLIDVMKMSLIFRIDDDIKDIKTLYDFQRIRVPRKKEYSLMENVVYISPFKHTEGDMYLKDVLNNPELYQEMIELLKEFDDNIISINADKNESDFSAGIVYKILSKNHKEALPLNVYGDGMKKAVMLMSAVIKAKNGILLLDEFETAIHTSAMSKIFSWIVNTCIKLNVQLFLTSHSEEAIKKLLNCEPKLQDNMRVITLMRKDDETKARILTGTKAIKVDNDYGMELR